MLNTIFGLALFIGLFYLLIRTGNRVFQNFENKIDRQFEHLGKELSLELKKELRPFTDRTWLAPRLEGEIPEGKISIYMEEEMRGGNRLPKTIVEIESVGEGPGRVKCCRKLPLTGMLKLNANVKTGKQDFDRSFVISAWKPTAVPPWLDDEIQESFMEQKKDFNNGMLIYEGRCIRFEWPNFFYSAALRKSLANMYFLLIQILRK